MRRIILAFATRNASILACWFFGRGVFLSSPIVDTMVGSRFRAVELCSTGCTLIGPMEGNLLLAIGDNLLLPSSFDGSFEDLRALPYYRTREPRYRYSPSRKCLKAFSGRNLSQMILRIASSGTARIAPNMPPIQNQNTSDRMINTGSV